MFTSGYQNKKFSWTEGLVLLLLAVGGYFVNTHIKDTVNQHDDDYWSSPDPFLGMVSRRLFMVVGLFLVGPCVSLPFYLITVFLWDRRSLPQRVRKFCVDYDKKKQEGGT